jgi:tetratricopeptide (TPR) repeat protein
MAREPVAPDRRVPDPESQAGPASRFLRQAQEECEKGDYGRAEIILQQIVEQRPDIGAAWHLRGIAASRAGDAGRAVGFFVRAVACDKANARYCGTLAEALGLLGRDGDALALWRRAIDIEPENSAWQAGTALCLARLERHRAAIPYFQAALTQPSGEAALHAAYGNSLQREGRVAEAADRYRAALARDPLLHQARLNLAAALRELGDSEGAATQCLEILRHQPHSVAALNNLGAALCALGRTAEAVRRLEAAIQLEPANEAALHNLGVALDAAGAMAEAETCLRKALALQPGFAEAHLSLANLLRGSGRLEEAAHHYRTVIENRPQDFRSYGNLGLVLLNLNRPHDAIVVYEKALALRPDDADIRTSLGIAQLLVGDYRNGWRNYEARWHESRRAAWRPGHAAKPWQGGSYTDLPPDEAPTILVHAEQGFGDTIHFCRYLPLVAATGAQVVFECQPSLVGLMATLTPSARSKPIRIVSHNDAAPAADYQVPLLSLPGIFGTTEGTIPAKITYLSAPPSKSARWAEYRFAEGLKVGLVWAGNPERQDDHMRSCPPEALTPLLADGVARFYAIGKNAPGTLPPGVIDLGPELSDFGDTAAVMENLDLIISVDTASAHLAGALGRPVWVMLGYAADWRYLMDREASPWYPTMRLFRQKAPADWLSVTGRIAGELRRYCRP